MIVMFRISPSKFLVLTAVTAIFILSVTFWITCSDFSFPQRKFDGAALITYDDIDCDINAEYTIACKKVGNEVYIPFSFLQKYFEIYGSMNGDHFEWAHSHGKINKPRGTYDPRGVFMYFENYNVEMRDRVKLIDGKTGVPISTQWSAEGYFYATQIAQFGLAHYSKNITDAEPTRHLIENGEDERAPWTGNVSRSPCVGKSGNCASFTSAISLNISNIIPSSDFVMSVEILFQLNASITVSLFHKETLYNIVYVASEQVVEVHNGNQIFYGLGTSPEWRVVTRDCFVDLQKGLQFSLGERRRKMRKSEVKLHEVRLQGTGIFDNLTFSTTEHLNQFFDAANWFIQNQNKTTGGWPIPVKRRLGSGFKELSKNWFSAMSQGHAISMLSRAYFKTGNANYLNAAVNALKLFKIPSQQGGILTTFLGKYTWFDEYPTTPSSFVLNGFIYSLFGLYDLATIAPKTSSNEARKLYDSGMVSLKKLLTLYDTGSGSTYDLRHFTLGIAPNLARWDYHATHVNQLLLLATIDNDPVINVTAERWKDYMKGIRAQHN